VYENIVSSVRKRVNTLHDYFNLRKKILRLEVLEHYDLRNPLIPLSSEEFDWKTACEDICEAFRPLGNRCSEMLREAFSKRWIDVLENKGKRSGAYSSGCYDSPPYILLNFNRTLDDVFTLAHELGHSFHSWLTNRTQPYHDAGISIFLSEIASNVCELLLHEYYSKKSDSVRSKLRLANHFADEFRGTVFRQAMFSEFEQEIYRLRFEGEPLSADTVSEIYYSINRHYHGANVSDDKTIAIEWARIPHFHYNFYVFKYVSGFAAAIKIVEKLKNERDFLEKYLHFLAGGSSAPAIKMLHDLGIFPEKEDFFDEAFCKFNSIIKEIENFSNI
ncbi:MAG: M3 family metallopeptidase, partial [Candidatus Nanoarchaeia archaeon]